MMKYKIVVFLISHFLFVNAVLSQTEILDSLYKVVKTEEKKSRVADTHGRICWQLINTDINAAQAHMDTARSIYVSENDYWGIAIADYKDGVMNRRRGRYEDAIEDLDRYMNFADTAKDRGYAMDAKYQYAVIYEEQGNFEKSLKMYFELLDDAKAQNSAKDLGFIYNSIGIVYKNLGSYHLSEEQYRKSLKALEGSDFKEDIGNAYRGLSAICALQGRYKEAEEYNIKAVEFYKSINNLYGTSLLYKEFGDMNFKQGKLLESEISYKKAKKIQEDNKYKELGAITVQLGRIYLKTSRLEQAKSSLLNVDESTLTVHDKVFLYKALMELYRTQQKNNLALLEYDKYVMAKDSLAGIEVKKSIDRLTFQYESATKDKEIVSQNLQIQDQQNTIALNKAKSTRNLMIAIGTLLALLFVLFYFRQRQKLKNNEIESLKLGTELNRLEALIEGEENERLRLAQDLHDGINGDLSVIKYKITSIDKNKLDDQETIEYNAAVAMLDNAIEQVRSISHDLAPPSLQNYNLVEAISQYCLKVSSGSNLKINFQNFGEIVDFNDDIETAIYRIVQELINNSVKHAKAVNMLVQLNYHAEMLHVSVEDDGIGYDTSNNKLGLGLKNIQSRAQFLEGELNVESSYKGTLTTLDINFN